VIREGLKVKGEFTFDGRKNFAELEKIVVHRNDKGFFVLKKEF